MAVAQAPRSGRPDVRLGWEPPLVRTIGCGPMGSNRPFIAARVELWLDRRAERLMRLLGWTERVITYTGYGPVDSGRVLGRVVLAPSWSDTPIGQAAEEFLPRLGAATS